MLRYLSGQRPLLSMRSTRLKPFFSLVALLFIMTCAQSAYAGLTITPTTWNVVGLDSNNTSVGPDTFEVGVRVCNTGGAPVTNVLVNFIWDSSNININLSGASTLKMASLGAGSCADFYYPVTVTRTSAAQNTARSYHITASGDLVGTVSTPTPREIYVEKIISQARNSVQSISGPTTVYVGQTYQYTVNASTAPGGYEQLEAFLTLSNVIFQVLSISTTYTAPAGGTNDKFYADACGWDPNPLSPTYRSCIGPANYAGGKAGGNISTTYTVKILSTGTTTATTLILDFSGSSYHYNADYGTGINAITITSLPPPVTLNKTATPSPVLTGGTVTYTVRVTNTGSTPYTLTDFVDTPPSSPASPTYVNNSSNFAGVAIPNPTISGGTLTWPGSFVIPAGQFKDLTYQMVMPSTPGTYTNRAIAHMNEFQIDTTPDTTDNSPATSNVTVQTPPDMTITKTHSGNFTQGQSGSYTITATNSGGSSTSGTVTVTDTLPTGLTPTSATGTGWTCNISAQTVTCTRSDALASQSSYPAITLNVSVAANSPLSVTNTATVSGGSETNTSNNTASDPTNINGVPDLTINKTHTGNFTRGLTGSYTITVNNIGTAATSGTVTVTDNVPAGLTPTAASGTGWTCNISGQTVTCTRSDVLSTGNSYPVINMTVSVLQTAADNVTNTATVSGTGELNTGNNSSSDATTIVSSADLSLTKTVDNATPAPGQNVTFTITASNAGPSDATGVVVKDVLPAGLVFVSATPSAGTYDNTTGLWTIGNINSGANPTLQVVARVNVSGASITNTAEVTASNQPDPDSTPNNNNPAEDDQSSVTLGVAAAPRITLTKSVSPGGTQRPGTDLTYTIVFTNTGGSAARNFVLTDPDPINTTLKINDNTDFKVGTAFNNLNTTGLLVVVSYSNDGGLTYTYTPISGGGGAPAGYDRNVTHVRWTFTGSFVPTSPNNTGNVGFTVRIR